MSLADWLAPLPHADDDLQQPVQWGIPAAAFGFVLAQVASLVGGVMVLVALGYRDADAIANAPLAVLFILQVPLWLGYGGVPLWVSSRKGNGIAADFGWRFGRYDMPLGLAIGALTQIVAVPLLYIPIFLVFGERDVSEAARELTERATSPADVAVLFFVVVVGAPVVEELFFRGLLLRSLARSYGSWIAVVGSALVFGIVHLQVLQFPALFMFGLITGWLAVRTQRLGVAIWAHVGFNLVTVVALLLLN